MKNKVNPCLKYYIKFILIKIKINGLLVFMLRMSPEGGQAPLDPCGPPTKGRGFKWGVRGEGSSAAGSPRSYTARIDLWHTGPSRARVLHEGGAPLSGGLLLNERNAITEQARPAGSLWLLGQPADRVSGLFKIAESYLKWS